MRAGIADALGRGWRCLRRYGIGSVALEGVKLEGVELIGGLLEVGVSDPLILKTARRPVTPEIKR